MSSLVATGYSLRRPYLTTKERNFRIAVVIWGIIILTFLSLRHRAAEELMKPGGIDLQAKLQALAWVGLGLVALRLVLNRRADVKLMLHPPLCWYCVFAFVAVLSTCYSSSPALTLFRSSQLVIVVLLVVSLRENLRRLYFFIGMYLGANWLLFLMANSGMDFGMEWVCGVGYEYLITGRQSLHSWRFASPVGHPSQISVVGAAGAAGLLARTHRLNWKRNVPWIVFFAVTVLLTISRTAIAGMLLGMFVVLVVRRRTIPMVLMGGLVIPLAVMIPSIGGALLDYGMRGQSTDEFKSMTGRTDIYQQGMNRAIDSLPLGEGFVAGRAHAIVSKEVGESIVHSHNLFIESAVGMGMMGVISAFMVLFTLVISLVKVVQLPPNASGISPGWEPVAMSIPLLGFCILDRGFASPAAPFLCLFVAVLTLTTKLLLDHSTLRRNSEPKFSREPKQVLAD